MTSILCLLAFAAASSATPPPQVAQLLQQYCFDCHGDGASKGGIRLDAWPTEQHAQADKDLWQRVERMISLREMPPDKKPQPTPEQRRLLLDWIDTAVFQVDCARPDPGRVTIRRLNRAEYNNTVRDLLGVGFAPADDFPVDDSGHGFDNIGDALSMPPVLLEKYLRASRQVLGAALGLHRPSASAVERYPVDLLEVGYNAKQQGDGWVALNSIEEDDVAVGYELSAAGDYIIRVKTYARQESQAPMRLTFMVDQQPVRDVNVSTNADAPEILQTRTRVPPGYHRLRAVVRRDKTGLSEAEALRWKSGTQQKGAVLIQWLEVEGPLDAAQSPATFNRLFGAPPMPGTEQTRAREILREFTRRAYRRPVTEGELERLLVLVETGWREGEPFAQGVELAMQAVLVSPHFLFRGELQPDPDNPRSVHPINEFSLASRLSYFLWSSMPDEELFAQAEQGTLRANLDQQVRRMLADPKARALVDHFAGQWLQLRNIGLLMPDRSRFKQFDESLRQAMRIETATFFDNIMREDRSVLELLDAEYTFVNERLARHYGLDGIQGDHFRRVSLQGAPRRGVLTHASILALTSNPTRTSPVKRGKWVLENLLNAPPPPPPPEVPELKEGKEASGTLRERMEQHRDNPLCASCHEKMDAIGFALENFDGIGAWRDQDDEQPIDATGTLGASGVFEGPLGLVAFLRENKTDQFVRCTVEKMFVYALGRGLEYHDKCAIEKICGNLARADYKFSELVLEIARSVPFQMRRGE